MEQGMVGRIKERQILRRCIGSAQAEWVAVDGRRGTGKTYLVQQLLGKEICFYLVGVPQCSMPVLLACFQEQLFIYSGVWRPRPKHWEEAFAQLRQYLESLPRGCKRILFIDELSGLDGPKSGFLMALDRFWQEWASQQAHLKLIVCSPATHKQSVECRGVTRSLHLAPFTLEETDEFLCANEVRWTRSQVAACYMVMGGIPLYLAKIDNCLGATANFDRLYFAEDAALVKEYDRLSGSLFQGATMRRRILEQFARKACGLTRDELAAALDMRSGGKLTAALDDLVACGLLSRYPAYGRRSKGMLYQLSDLHALFCLHWLRGEAARAVRSWSQLMASPSFKAWRDYAFLQLCLHHVERIEEKLGIAGVETTVCSWSCKADSAQGLAGARFDLVLVRRDHVIHLCEIRYSLPPSDLLPAYWQELRERREAFRRATSTKKALQLTLITAHRIDSQALAEDIQCQLTLDDLF